MQVHDLLRIDSGSFNGPEVPCWVTHAIDSCSWVVVRRAPARLGMVAVGVRGQSRGDRWGGWISVDRVRECIQPAELRHRVRIPPRTATLQVLQEVVSRWRELTLHWGPTGSVGFELASGREVTTEASDLDIVIRAPTPMSAEHARFLWRCVQGLPTRVDVRAETPACGFSLDEYVCRPSTRILLRYPDGLRLGDDPWRECSRS